MTARARPVLLMAGLLMLVACGRGEPAARGDGGDPARGAAPATAQSLASVAPGAARRPSQTSDLPNDRRRVEVGTVQMVTPRQVPAGAPFDVEWRGPAGSAYLAIAVPGSSDDPFPNRTRVQANRPIEVRAPDRPGRYEIRAVDATGQVRFSAPLVVTEVTATLAAPDTVRAGAPVEVAWTGPNTPDDFVAVAVPTDPGSKTADYARTRRGPRLVLRAPTAPGVYQLRYVMSQSDRILARRPLVVTPVTASLTVPETLMVDTVVEIGWRGPGHPGDRIVFAEQGAPDGEAVTAEPTAAGPPLSIRTPARPGRYELRYLLHPADRVVARTVVTVLPLQARLSAPARAIAGTELPVAWNGPNGAGDFIAVAVPGAPVEAYESRALSRAGTPARVFAPATPGRYELRYVRARTDSILARQPLTVTSREAPAEQ